MHGIIKAMSVKIIVFQKKKVDADLAVCSHIWFFCMEAGFKRCGLCFLGICGTGFFSCLFVKPASYLRENSNIDIAVGMDWD